MKKALSSILCALMLLTAAPAFAGSAQQEKPQQFCPVMGGRVNKGLHTDYQGKRIYFCCAYCIGEFQKNPEKYLEKMKQDGVSLENAPETDKAAAPKPENK
ncbi:MAG: YHS domain-containing protein [Thermodesulfobacteriota bacterium]